MLPLEAELVTPESGANRVQSLIASVLSMGLSMESQRYSSFQSAPFPPPPLVDFGFVEWYGKQEFNAGRCMVNHKKQQFGDAS